MTRKEAKARGQANKDSTFFDWFRDIEEDKFGDTPSTISEINISHLKTIFKEAFSGLYRKPCYIPNIDHSKVNKKK
jgi:hypothetical protein